VRVPIGATHLRRMMTLSLLATVLAAGTFVRPLPASAAVSRPRDCRNPSIPTGFHREIVTAIRASRDLPIAWGRSPYLPKIACWQGTGFDTRFSAHAPGHVWHGLFAMTVREMAEIAGPSLGNDRKGLVLQPACFVGGWDVCRHTVSNTRIVQQLVAGMRWIWLVYGHPFTAWRHIVRTRRFTSYPRPGTDDTVTRSPFSMCPVKRPVTYQDDFGEPRTTGGFHPHEGNDIHAPLGRPIRAPFPGLAVPHIDDWLAGLSVGLVGAEGFVRNAHLSRFGHLGYVRAGTVIGYVGDTGDALSFHDHFEWHPWVVPDPLHVAPSGYSRVRTAIDPFPFLNHVCR